MSDIRNRRAIINRKNMITQLDVMCETSAPHLWQTELTKILKTNYQTGWNEVKRRFDEDAENGRKVAVALSYLTDQTLRILYDFTTEKVFSLANATASERLCLVATGGYGRGELAPYSDVDLLFIIPYKSTAWAENVVEYMLYVLWDLGLKVGHATRTPADCVRLAKEDLTIRTSLLEARYLWGDQKLFKEAERKFIRRVVAPTGKQFVEEKLAERDQRHKKLGDSRYVVEPNIKDGKGGLRDLQTMWWIARYLYGAKAENSPVDNNILTANENRQYNKATSFLWTVRVAMHFIANRAEERLSFDMQRQLSEILNYKDHPGTSGVERFMKHYFLVAKQVGDLTRIFCAVLEERQQKPAFLDRFKRTVRVSGFINQKGRLNVSKESDLIEKPENMVRIFAVADKHKLDIHPSAIRTIKQNLNRLNNQIRKDPSVNQDFIEVLTSRNAAEINLRRMNEAGVFGQLIPDFGRVVAQMQYDMYHHYTVDEHTIRAIGLTAKIEAGLLEEDHPLASKIINKVVSRRVLYVAVLLHDIAKGRGGDHSVIGAEVAQSLCPRLGLNASETETVAWLVLHHLLMSHTAFKRDLSDHKTILDFCDIVKSPERLRLLLVLTVVDIRAVGPGVWNAWKGQLLRDLYSAAEEVLVAGHVNTHRSERVNMKKSALAERLDDWPEDTVTTFTKRMADAYWIAENTDTHTLNARLTKRVDENNESFGVTARIEVEKDMTRLAVYMADHPGMFARVVGALRVAGASIVDAKIHTSLDGMAIENFTLQTLDGSAFDSRRSLDRLEETILGALNGSIKSKQELDKKPVFAAKQDAFTIEPVVLIDNRASNQSTVIEVNAKDRPGLLYDLAYTLYHLKLSLFSAHVATYGERAVDVFYVKDLTGQKISNKVRLRNIEDKLLKAARNEPIFNRKKKSAKETAA
ncbi:[protein-PII] uridylyltransferase [Kordiimonas sp. SCSIO 12610]|uniref:[protein-PII] uridylyltransferase n=1 Tax=Kordiimonas sp. SCSIO 12610 TaxID=2829597 RepID=UPI00210D18DA|nr:[protein-PII] uridylyltransferase [Kordiimonas sp. SCSIO 12610]UTW55520.1 [protein-PII] uridylyltransferase [Kordiimonas sp. SCSIO 12610]